MFKKLWNDQSGVILSGEIVMLSTILVIGMITGATSMRDAVITELADIGGAFGNIDQSFTISEVFGCRSSATSTFSFVDTFDFCDTTTGSLAFTPTRCLIIAGNGTGIIGFDTGH